MLKYKKHTFASILDGAEDLTDLLAGMSGKNRRIVSLSGEHTALLYFRLYRDAEQIVDIPCDMIQAASPQWIPMDIPLAEGQLLKAGYYNNTTGTVTVQEIVIGYEETG